MIKGIAALYESIRTADNPVCFASRDVTIYLTSPTGSTTLGEISRDVFQRITIDFRDITTVSPYAREDVVNMLNVNIGCIPNDADIDWSESDLPVAGTPHTTNAITEEDTQSIGGFVITPNVTNGDEVTHFKIAGITNGTLYQNDGIKPISDSQFITVAQGAAGLKFTPNSGFIGIATFEVQASLSGNDAGLGGQAITLEITVNPVQLSGQNARRENTLNGCVISPRITHAESRTPPVAEQLLREERTHTPPLRTRRWRALGSLPAQMATTTF